jgi:hypothetical protein
MYERAGGMTHHMNARRIQDVEARLKTLERMNKILFAGLALVVLPWIATAAEKIPELIEGTSGKFKTVEAQQIVLIDDAGNKVGGLIAGKDATNLTIKDSNGKRRLLVGFVDGNPTIQFANKNGGVVATYAEKNGWFEYVQ